MYRKVFLVVALGLHPVPAAGRSAGIVEENLFPGTRAWLLSRLDPNRIEAFGSATSAAAGEDIRFYVHTSARQFQIEIYRLGWYGGPGGRLYHSAGPLPGRVQPPCPVEPSSRMRSCSHWLPSYTLRVPGDWLSGVYWAKLTELDAGAETAVVFVVRNDQSAAAILVQLPVATWQAYNAWGGKSLYEFNSTDDNGDGLGDRAYKVSFDRPYEHPLTQSLQYEFQMVRWLEREGFDVTYSTNIDTHARPDLLLRRRAWITLGHDEYWSREMRDHVEAARQQGVHLGFFGGNMAYWQVRFEPSALGPQRTMVCYRAASLDPYFTAAGGPADPSRVTVRFREAPVNRPENSLLGVMFGDRIRYGDPLYDWVAANTGHWAFSGTSMRDGDRISSLVGYEFDWVVNNGLTPPGLTVLSRSPVCAVRGPCTQFSNSSIYQHASGAWVFAAGSIQWGWRLDSFRAWCADRCPESVDERLSVITANVLRRFQGRLPARMLVSDASLEFLAAAGVRPGPKSVAITHQGTEPVGWRARAGGAAWIRLSPGAGMTPSTLSVTVEPAGLAPGVHRTIIEVQPLLGADAASGPEPIEVILRVEAPAIQPGGIVNGANFAAGRALSPGSVASLFGAGLAAGTEAASALPLPTKLGDAEVLVNGVPAPLFFVSPRQINFQMPSEARAGPASIAVRTAGLTGAPVSVQVAEFNPEIFLAPSVSPSAGAVLNEDGWLNTPNRPAQRGSVIQVFATGLGSVLPPLASGRPAAATEPLHRVAAPVQALIDGAEADILYAGLAPGFVGVYQVNIRLPADVAGVATLAIQMGAPPVKSNTVTLFVE